MSDKPREASSANFQARLSPNADRLLRLLCRGEQLTTKEAASALGVSGRTVRSLRGELAENDVSLEERYDGHAKRFFLEEGNRKQFLTPVSLSERQMEALTVAIKAASSLLAPTHYSQPLADAFEEINREWLSRAFTFEPEEERDSWDFGSFATQEIPEQTFEVLTEALRNQQTVILDYYTASRDKWTYGRKIDPYQFAFRQGSWMLAAYCHNKREVRDFSLVGMRNVEAYTPGGKDSYFSVRKTYDRTEHFHGRGGAIAGDVWKDVRLLVEPEAAPYFKRKRYHESQEIVEERADGRLIVTFRIRGLKGFISGIRSWGPLATVLEPEELQEQLTAEFYELAGRYMQITNFAQSEISSGQ